MSDQTGVVRQPTHGRDGGDPGRDDTDPSADLRTKRRVTYYQEA
jgi:hypothetical protein